MTVPSGVRPAWPDAAQPVAPPIAALLPADGTASPPALLSSIPPRDPASEQHSASDATGQTQSEHSGRILVYVPVEVEAWAPRVVRGAPLGPPLPDVPALDLLATPVLPSPVEVPGTSPAATTAPARTSPLVMMSPTRININTATQAELEVLPGIGPSLAKAIIDHRQQHGPFKTLQDVDKVRGIGPRMLDKIGPMLVFEEPKPTRPATRPSSTAGTATPSPSPRGPK